MHIFLHTQGELPTPHSFCQYGAVRGRYARLVAKPTALRTTYRVENSVGSGSGVRNERVSNMIYKYTILTMRKIIPVYKITC